ncbi:MAG: hypothetical protein ACD_72C00212G0003 [uncultured bacterium]|nr:MAG: hypothetical protein ACD_72C00212G0003 [uncultured bacterium]HBY73163.1 hypothetical protein [Candidatus Kerfeldbacteria bacterium]
MDWKNHLNYDPIEPLLKCGYEPIVYFTKKDLLNEKTLASKILWQLPAAQKILNKQQADGSWKYLNPKPAIRDANLYNLYETFRQVGFLVEQFGFDKRHPAIQRAKKFILAHQSPTGDIRGIYWNQYSPNYTAGFLELLIKTGYINDPQVLKGLQWLLSIRQTDGGWAIPARTRNMQIGKWKKSAQPVAPDITRPFSYMVTGVVLRAFAYHPDYQNSSSVHNAAELVLSKLFKRDVYPDRASTNFWTGFSFPFCYTDLISVLDPMAYLGFSADQPKIKEGLDWFVKHQNKNGTWKLHILKGDKKEMSYWINLSIGRLFKKYYGS